MLGSDSSDDEFFINVGVIKRPAPRDELKSNIEVLRPINEEPNCELESEDDRPWTKPGADLTDYFNFGFDEETWFIYRQRQEKLRFLTPSMVPTTTASFIEQPMMCQSKDGLPDEPTAPTRGFFEDSEPSTPSVTPSGLFWPYGFDPTIPPPVNMGLLTRTVLPYSCDMNGFCDIPEVVESREQPIYSRSPRDCSPPLTGRSPSRGRRSPPVARRSSSLARRSPPRARRSPSPDRRSLSRARRSPSRCRRPPPVSQIEHRSSAHRRTNQRRHSRSSTRRQDGKERGRKRERDRHGQYQRSPPTKRRRGSYDRYDRRQ